MANDTATSARGKLKKAKSGKKRTAAPKRGVSVNATRSVGRPAAPVYTRQDVIRIALKIIDEQGPDNVSMRRIGRELGVTAASLYHYFKNKEEILVSVVRHLLHDVTVPEGEFSWQEHVIRSTLAYREAVAKHPNAVPLLLTRSWREFGLNVVDKSIRKLDEAGVPAELHLVIMRASEMLGLASVLFDKHSNKEVYGDTDPRHDALAAALAADHWTSEESLELILKALVMGFSTSLTMNALSSR